MSARPDLQPESFDLAGEVSPQEAWEAFSRGAAFLVDVRTAEELAFVGRLPGSLHIPWATGLNMAPNPDFLEQLATLVPRQAEVLFLCRSGKRSLAAARLAAANGWHRAYNIAEGFEGELDPGRQRGKLNGWRRRGLPWVQD